MLNERFELAINRIKEIQKENILKGSFGDYFFKLSELILMIMEPDFTPEYNKKLYEDILPENYEKSYCNPAYSAEKLCLKGEKSQCDTIKMTGAVNAETLENTGFSADDGKIGRMSDLLSERAKRFKISQMLCYLYSEVRGLIPYSFELKYYQNKDEGDENPISTAYKEILTIYMELVIEIYVLFIDAENDGNVVKSSELYSILYWFVFDNCDIISPLRIRQQLDPKLDFATGIVCEYGDSDDVSYLYRYGEYVTDNEILVSQFLSSMSQEEIEAMAATYTEGYRIGFVKAGKPLDRKTTVNIRYNLGFERVIKAAIRNFEDMGLKPVIYRAGSLSLDRRGVNKIGYLGAIPNKQYDYDHREDEALYLDRDFVNRKTLVVKNTYEKMKELASGHAGPAVMEVFGENPFSPKAKGECITLDVVGRKNQVDINDRLSQLTNEYIRGDERSFTIISYPVPEIGDDFAAIFSETVKLNTLDYISYEKMQQYIIDVLDTAKAVRIEGSGVNKTRLTVQTHKITDATKQTSFENCVADVNIPVGEVFTSPVLKGTNGILNVSEVYLFGLNYIDLTITFKDGMITDYSCANFDSDEENRKYIRENILHNHETLPIGEFAIGTNTTAYRMARDYHIEDRMPILIGEKTGPHFAVGDTCYSHEEDVRVYNPDGKEIIAKDNEITSEYRNSNPSRAYFNCHTDITIPYDELSGIYAVHEDGSETAIIENGRFVLKGLEALNIPLDK